jgi:outer membrane protein TolC
VPAGDDIAIPPPDPLAAWEARALAANVDLGLARADLEAARLAARDARTALLPTLTAEASASLGSQAEGLSDAVGGLTGSDAYPAVGAGLELAIPLGNKAARADAARTRAAYEAARVTLEGLERSVRAEVREAHRAVATAAEALSLAEMSRDLSERNAELEETRFREGTRTLDRLLEARLAAERAALEAERARATLAGAVLDLRALAGEAESTLLPGA